jgi:toxin ParE1/3/4
MSKFRLEFLEEAVAEAQAAHDWYAGRSQNAAGRFMDELDQVLSKITEDPGRWPKFYKSARYAQMRRYPFLVIFRKRADFIEVIAVAHAKRKPGYWKKRLK